MPQPGLHLSAHRYPLSSTQQGMIFSSDLAKGEGVYTEQLALDMPEPIEPDTLRKAFQIVIDRHDLFRTSFHQDATGAFYQIVHKAVSVPWEVRDWRASDDAARKSLWFTLLESDRRLPWNHAQPPVMRCTLLHLNDSHWRLLWSFHHAIADGRACVAAVRELAQIYRAHLKHERVELPSPVPFRDYVRWLQERDADSDASHWRSVFDGFVEPLEVGEFRKDLPFRYETITAEIPPDLARQVVAFIESQGLPFSVLTAATWALLLARIKGCEDIVFGVTVATRWARIHGANAAGLFINTLPFRILVSPDADVNPWLEDVRSRWKSLRSHERTPLLEVKRCSVISAGQPMFQTLVMYDWIGIEDGVARNLPQRCQWSAHLTETLDTRLTVALFGTSNLTLKIGYDMRYFRPEEARRFQNLFQTVLHGLTAGAVHHLGDIPLLTPRERQTQLFDWNASPCDFPQDACIHHLFEAQARESPETTAIVFEGHSLTYGDLNARAEMLAGQLSDLDVGPDVLVGIVVERSLEMLVGLLAILKAGGAFVPIDPEDPPARQHSALDQAQVKVLLTQERLLASLPRGPFKVFCLDRDRALLPASRASHPRSAVRAEHLAYVIFTSGSTGRPKGVMVSHRNVVGFLHAFRHVTGELGRRIGTNVAPFNFDTSIDEIWSCLCFGGTVHIMRPEHSTDGATFARYLVEHGITTTYIIPSMLPGVAEHMAPLAHRLRLNCLLTGLHAKKQRTLQAFRELVPGLRIVNGYGPTETTYGATAFIFQHASDPDLDVPIGVPFPGYRTYIVDSRLQPLPVGVPGELLIGGIGVARGYLGQPELTERAFIPDPWSSQPGAQLYRTGDVCRFQSDGVIEFLGRADRQVKIRGFRVELAEVESALADVPGIKEVAVAALPDSRGELRLAAYIVGDSVPLTAELRAYLRKFLPNYMIPSAFVHMEALPRTTAGKLNPSALPVPRIVHVKPGSSYSAPRTVAEKFLVELWKELLELDKVGIHDSFFDLGGESLKAFRVIARINHALGIEIPISTLFEQPTIAELAPLIE